MLKVEKFLDALNDVDPAFVAAADMPPRKKRRIRWGLIAACIALLTSVTAVAAGDLPTRVLSFFTGHTEPGSNLRESSYTLSIAIDKVPFEDLTGEIRSVPEQIRHQFLTYNPLSSWWPGHWQRRFDSPDEATEFIGYPKLRLPELSWEGTQTILSVYGDAQGDVFEVILENDYVVGDVRLQAYAHIYTEYHSGEITYSSHTTEDITFEESFYTTASDKLCHIIASSPMESGYRWLDGFLVKEGVLHSLHAAFLEKDTESALELLQGWADLF